MVLTQEIEENMGFAWFFLEGQRGKLSAGYQCVGV